MAGSRIIIHRKKIATLVSVLAISTALPRFVEAADSKAADLPPMMSPNSVITPDMLKKQLGDDYLEMNGDDMFSEPDPLGSVKSPVPENLKESDKKAAETTKSADTKPATTTSSDKTSPAFENKTAPKKAPITAIKPVESAPLSAPDVIEDKAGDMPVAFPAEKKPLEAPKIIEAPKIGEPAPIPDIPAQQPPAPPALATNTKPDAAKTTASPKEDAPFYKKAWNSLFSSDEKKEAKPVAEAQKPAPVAPKAAEIKAPELPKPVEAVIAPPQIPADNVVPPQAAAPEAPSPAADIMPVESKQPIPPALELAVPPAETKPAEKPKPVEKAEPAKPVKEPKSGESKNLADQKKTAPEPTKKPAPEQKVELPKPEPLIAKEPEKLPEMPEPVAEATKSEPIPSQPMPAMPEPETAKSEPVPVIQPEEPVLPPAANAPKADYPLPDVAVPVDDNGNKLPFADIQSATPVETIKPESQKPETAKPEPMPEPQKQAVSAPLPSNKPEVPKDMQSKYEGKREAEAMKRKYPNDKLTKRYKGDSDDAGYVPAPGSSYKSTSASEVKDLAPLSFGDTPNKPYDNGLSAPTERMLKKFPKGISSLHGKDDEKPAGAINIDRGNNESAFPKDGYSDEAPIGMSVSGKGSSTNVDILLEQAYNAVQLDQMESAIELYKQAVAKHPEHKQALFGLATAYQKNNQSRQARTVYERLLKLYPDYADALNNFLVLVSEESPSSALKELSKLEKRNPEFSPILAQMGLIYMRQEDYRNAANYLGRAMALSPENLSYRYNMAIVMDNMGEYDEAISLYEQILAARKSGTSLPFKAEGIEERLTFLRSNRS